VPLPTEPGRWLTFGWVLLLGALAGSVAGIAASALPGSATSVTTAVSALTIVLQFFSGVFFAPDETPAWMQQVAALFPLKWLNQGLRSVFLPDGAAAFEPAGGWEHGTTALVLAGWAIIGAVICARTFRWRRAEG
jgi:ABC-2 type transport system permease protein